MLLILVRFSRNKQYKYVKIKHNSFNRDLGPLEDSLLKPGTLNV